MKVSPPSWRRHNSRNEAMEEFRVKRSPKPWIVVEGSRGSPARACTYFGVVLSLYLDQLRDKSWWLAVGLGGRMRPGSHRCEDVDAASKPFDTFLHHSPREIVGTRYGWRNKSHRDHYAR